MSSQMLFFKRNRMMTFCPSVFKAFFLLSSPKIRCKPVTEPSSHCLKKTPLGRNSRIL